MRLMGAWAVARVMNWPLGDLPMRTFISPCMTGLLTIALRWGSAGRQAAGRSYFAPRQACSSSLPMPAAMAWSRCRVACW